MQTRQVWTNVVSIFCSAKPKGSSIWYCRLVNDSLSVFPVFYSESCHAVFTLISRHVHNILPCKTKKAVTAYLKSEQLLLFSFVWQYYGKVFCIFLHCFSVECVSCNVLFSILIFLSARSDWRKDHGFSPVVTRKYHKLDMKGIMVAGSYCEICDLQSDINQLFTITSLWRPRQNN